MTARPDVASPFVEMRPVNIVIVTRAGNGDLIIWALNIKGYSHELPVQEVLTGRF
jgi:hypothetical protein